MYFPNSKKWVLIQGLTQLSREWYENSEFRFHQVVAHVGAYGLTSKKWSHP